MAALASMTRWSRPHNFCAVIMLLSPSLSSSYRLTANNFVQSRFASNLFPRTQRKYISPREAVESSIESDADADAVPHNYKRGQAITFAVLRFGPMGASVSIDDDKAYGLVLQREIALFRESRDGVDVEVGEVIQGFVERIREDGKIDVSIRPLGLSRIVVVKQLIFDAIEGSPEGSIPLGDKSTPEDIGSYFHGISKKDFKNAIGSLYREGLVAPGGLMTSLVPDENRKASRITAEATKVAKATVGEALRISKEGRPGGDRDSTKSVFIGNLPNKITRDEVLKVIVKVLGQGCVTDLRLSLDENMRPRGFGYVELKDESMVDRAIEELSGMEIGGRILRTDYADPTRRQKAEVSAPSSTAAPASSSRTAPSSSSSKSDASAWKQGFKNPAAAASLSGKEKSPSKAVKANTSAVSATEGAPVAKRVLDNAAAAAGAGAASSSSWSSSVSGVGGGIVKLPASKLMALNIPDKSAAKEGTFRDRGDSKPAQEESKSWVKEAERSLKFKKPTSPASYSLDNAPARKAGKAGATLFFGNLSLDLDEKALTKEIELFTGPGTVTSVRFPTDKDSTKSKGYAFVDMPNVLNAKRIFEEMHGHEMLGKICNIDDATRS